MLPDLLMVGNYGKVVLPSTSQGHMVYCILGILIRIGWRNNEQTKSNGT